MIFKAFIVTLLTSTSIMLAGCVATSVTSAKSTVEPDLAAITAFNQRYLKAINDGDFTALSNLTNADHIMIAPNSLPIVGKAANDVVNRRAAEQVNIVEKWTPVETQVSGDLAYQRGTFTVQATPKTGGATRTLQGSFLRIYKRQPNGEWWMTHDMFNSDGQTSN